MLAQVIDAAHLAIGEQLSVVLDDAVRPLGLTAECWSPIPRSAS